MHEWKLRWNSLFKWTFNIHFLHEEKMHEIMIMYNVFFSLPLFFPTCWFYSFELVLFYAYVSFVSSNQKEQQWICVEFNCVTPKSVHLYVDVDVTCLHESDLNFMFLSPNVASCAIPSHVLNRMICMNVHCASVCLNLGYWIVGCELFVRVTQ